MKDKIQTVIVCFVTIAIFALLLGCQSTGSQTRDSSHDPYRVGRFYQEKG